MQEINLLRDSRGRFYDFSPPQRIFLLIFLGFLLLSELTWLVVLFQQKLKSVSFQVASSDNQVLAAETTSFANLLPTPFPQKPNQEEFQHAEQEIVKISSTPLRLIFQTKQENLEQVLDSFQIKNLLATSVWGKEVLVVLNPQNLDQVVADLAQKIDRESKIEVFGQAHLALDRQLNQVQLKQILRDELLRRQQGLIPQAEIDITSLVQEFPGSDGQLAHKYLEVDLSQQKLYQWENGQLVGNRIISTGKYGPTPVGIHQIMNKAVNAWSPPAQVWTPFWMAYSYNPDLQAYLGFHELPYWEGPHGEKIRRSFDTLGVPVTGGCIQLNIGEAEEVFNWAEVEMVVFIHE